MTEKEAIKVIETEKQCVVLRNGENGCDGDCICCDLVMAENDIICGYDTAIKAIEEIQQYREIGTVEECREAIEKQNAKEPVEYEGKYYACPNCDNLLMPKWERYPFQLKDKKNGLPYCLSCGQAILWEEE